MNKEANEAMIAKRVDKIVSEARVLDIHTHLYAPAFGKLLLWGIDELLVYHYLLAEAFRYFKLPYDKFHAMSKAEQAELVWDELFVKRSPVSEACRGVITSLNRLGLEPRQKDLNLLRKWFAEQDTDEYVSRCMELAGVDSLCMTNSPFDDAERQVWDSGFDGDGRFVAALRIDPLLVSWPKTCEWLKENGYDVEPEINDKTAGEVRRFLGHWKDKMRAEYVMVSLPPDFEYPSSTACSKLIDAVVAPFCAEHGIPFALMIGVKRGVNKELKLAGDGVGWSKLEAVENLCGAYPEVKFMVTALSREVQHTLCVVGRKFRNLHIFGCWWFTNVPHLIEEITRMRLELLGTSFTAQHSDARVIDQIIYKWDHSRSLIAKVLADKYIDLARAGWEVSDEEIKRDVTALFGGEFKRFAGGH